MPHTEEIPRNDGGRALEALTSEHEGGAATIEVVGLDLGDQVEGDNLPLSYIEYDPHDDAVSVGVGGLDN